MDFGKAEDYRSARSSREYGKASLEFLREGQKTHEHIREKRENKQLTECCRVYGRV